MRILCASSADFDAWIALAREVEHLFGPMADKVSFRKALQQAIFSRNAFGIKAEDPEAHAGNGLLKGGIVVSRESNEILWFAVSERFRGHGLGRMLLQFALDHLNLQKCVMVQTFHGSVADGQAARRLYADFGFVDHEDGGLNPAGLPTVIMRLSS